MHCLRASHIAVVLCLDEFNICAGVGSGGGYALSAGCAASAGSGRSRGRTGDAFDGRLVLLMPPQKTISLLCFTHSSGPYRRYEICLTIVRICY